MSSSERSESHERELMLKHQPSFSDSGRASVPMYADSQALRWADDFESTGDHARAHAY